MRDLAQKSTGLDIMHEFQKDSLWYLPPSLQIYTKLILYVSIYSQVQGLRDACPYSYTKCLRH